MDTNLYAMPRVKRTYTSISEGSGDYSAAKRSRPSYRKNVKGLTKLLREYRPEVKFVDTFVGGLNMVTNNAFLLNGIAQGDDKNSRDGRTILLKNLRLKAFFVEPSTSTLSCFFSWAIVYDRQPNGAALTWTTVYDSTVITDQALGYPDVLSHNKRFKILRSGSANIPMQGAVMSPVLDEFIDLTVALKGEDRKTEYGSTTNTIASITKGSIYFIFATSSQATFAPSSNYATMTASSRINFIDN